MNAAEIKAACKLYNADFHDCVADVDAGSPQVRVTYGAKQGSRFINFTVTAGVYCSGFIAAHDPVVHQIPRRDRRVAFSGCIAKYANRLGNQHCSGDVPVVVVGRCV